MARSRQVRVFQNEARVIELLRLDTVDAYKAWINSEELFLQYWNKFKEQWLDPQREANKSSTKRKRDAQLEEVRRLIVIGEAHGSRRYSRDIIKPQEASWDGKDWLAWLLYKLVDVNTKDVNGVFYEKGLQLQDREDIIWQVIQRSLWKGSRSRVTRSMVDSPTTSATSSHTASEPSRVPEKKSSNGGEVNIFWENIDKDLQRNGHSVSSYIEGLEDLDWGTFEDKVRISFDLNNLELRIAALIISEDTFARIPLVEGERPFELINRDTFKDLCEYSLRLDEALTLKLRTAKAVPSLLVKDPVNPDNVSGITNPYDLMVAEMSSRESNNTDRFWKWAKLRSAANVDSATAPRITDQDLSTKDINSEEMALQWLHHLRTDPDGEDEENPVENSPSLQIHEITAQEMETHREQESFLGNLDYERQGRRQACNSLQIPNADMPRIPGMRPSVTLEPWQPSGIKALVDFEDGQCGGGVLADLVGLGKTWEVTGLLQFRLNERRVQIDSGANVEKAKPALILVPANLISQWADEIKRISNDFKIEMYYGGRLDISRHENISRIKGILTNSDAIFNGSEGNARRIVLTSYKTFLARHGPTAYKNHLIDKRVSDGASVNKTAAKAYVEEAVFNPMPQDPDPEWEGGLGGCFERVILDEGHEIRNIETQTWQAIRWLRASYRVIATATPLIDSLKDFAGLIGMVQPRDNLWSEESLESLGAFALVPKEDPDALEDEEQTFDKDAYHTRFDPWEFDENLPVAILRKTPESYLEHIVKLPATNHERGKRARALFKSCVLRRTYNSEIDGNPINRNLPMVQKTNYECSFTKSERIEYDAIFSEALKKLHKKKGDDVIFDTNQYRRLILSGTWLDFRFLLHYRVKKLKEFRKKAVTAHSILKDTVERQLQLRIHPSRMMTLPGEDDNEAILREFCRGAPKLRALSQLIADIVIMRKEKVVVWCTLPAQQLFLELYLQAAGVDAQAFHADLDMDERRKLSNRFNNTDEVSVMLGGLFMSVTGLNWQKRCRTCIFFDPPPSKGIEDQAFGRVYRVGQRNWVRLIRLSLEDSFDKKITSKMIVKSLPGLMTEINIDAFGTGSGDGVKLNPHVLKDGRLVLQDDLTLLERSRYKVLPADEMLLYLEKSIRGEPLILSNHDSEALEKSQGRI